MSFFDTTGWDGGAPVPSRKSSASPEAKRYHHDQQSSTKTTATGHGEANERDLNRRSRSRSSRDVPAGEVPGHHSSDDTKPPANPSSRRSFFGLGRFYNKPRSRRSLSRGRTGHSPSHFTRRQPRPAFLRRMYRKLRRLLRDLAYYARRHPLKVLALVVVPLVTTVSSALLATLLARFGLRLPPLVERLLSLGAAGTVAAGGGAGAGVGAGAGAATAAAGAAGLVGEAVRVAGDWRGGANGAATGAVRVERGRAGHVRWVRKTTVEEHDGWGSVVMDGLWQAFS